MHILHLEDDGPLREILKIALEAVDPDCDLKQFISSDEADEYFRSNHPKIDLYILDIRVPGSMNGMQLAEKIRTIDTTGAIVMTSAYGRPKEDFLKTNKCEWCTKPWHILETPQMLLRLAKESKLKKATTEMPQVKTSVEAPPMDTQSIDTPPQVKLPTGTQPQVKTSIEAPPMDTPPIDAPPQVKLPTGTQPQVKTSVEAPPMDTQPIDTQAQVKTSIGVESQEKKPTN
jgi:CheY-like chemotaxis protein